MKTLTTNNINRVKHRSTARYYRHIFSIPASGIFRCLLPPAIFFTALAALAGLYATWIATGGAPAWCPQIDYGITPFTITGSAMSFLLVFRREKGLLFWGL